MYWQYTWCERWQGRSWLIIKESGFSEQVMMPEDLSHFIHETNTWCNSLYQVCACCLFLCIGGVFKFHRYKRSLCCFFGDRHRPLKSFQIQKPCQFYIVLIFCVHASSIWLRIALGDRCHEDNVSVKALAVKKNLGSTERGRIIS